MAFLDGTGLGTVWGRIKAWVAQYANITSSTSNGSTTNTLNIGTNSVVIPNRTSELNNDAGFITDSDIPEGAAASSATPLMDGTASAGESNAFARGDHRHPSDTSKLSTSGGTITGTLTVNNGITVPTGNLTLEYGNVYTDKILTYDQADRSANKVWSTNGDIVDLSTKLSGYLPLSGGTMATTGAIYFDTGGYIQYDSTTTGVKVISPEVITMTGEEGISLNVGTGKDILLNGSGDINLEGATDILLSASQVTIYCDLYMRDGGVIAYDQVDRSNTKVWNTNGGMVDLSNYAATANIGQANGIASLDSSGKVPSSQLPSYVDDVVEIIDMASSDPSTCAAGDIYYNTSSKKLFTATAADTWGSTGVDPQAGVIYILTKSNHATYSQNSEFRWGGSSMVQLYDGGASALSSAEIEAACPYNS